MKIYSEQDLLRIAKRHNNKKRSYLLVNPKQAKHIPVSPSDSLKMMRTLGLILREKYPETKLIVGFAETATAIGATVASCFEESMYIHTTRENVAEVRDWVYFSEEHSHATEQKLCADKLEKIMESTETIIFVDDELSTGKTLINVVERIRDQFPQIREKKIIIATLINRVSNDNIKLLESFNIVCEQLLKLDNIDYSSLVDNYSVEAPMVLNSVRENDSIHHIRSNVCLPDPRMGVDSQNYYEVCSLLAKEVIGTIGAAAFKDKKILVLGTEECMFPALILGSHIESNFLSSKVFSHSTTRSPIAVSSKNEYPITSGCMLHSFYEDNRETFIYNVQDFDTIIIITDSKDIPTEAMADISEAFRDKYNEMFVVKGG